MELFPPWEQLPEAAPDDFSDNDGGSTTQSPRDLPWFASSQSVDHYDHPYHTKYHQLLYPIIIIDHCKSANQRSPKFTRIHRHQSIVDFFWVYHTYGYLPPSATAFRTQKGRLCCDFATWAWMCLTEFNPPVVRCTTGKISLQVIQQSGVVWIFWSYPTCLTHVTTLNPPAGPQSWAVGKLESVKPHIAPPTPPWNEMDHGVAVPCLMDFPGHKDVRETPGTLRL